MSRRRRVHWGSVGFTHARIGVAGFIRYCVGDICRKFHSSSRKFTRASSSSFGLAWVQSGAPRSFPVHCVWRGFTLALLVLTGLICIRVDSLVRAYGSMGLSGFA